jgi:hypothetical protein
MQGAGIPHVAATERPSNVEAGDLVLGHFQQGSEDGAWYRGRVVEARRGKCDIAYDNGNIELRVPLTAVILVEKGSERPEWLLKVKATTVSRGKMDVTEANEDQSFVVTYKKNRNAAVKEVKSYLDVVQEIFQILQAGSPYYYHPR